MQEIKRRPPESMTVSERMDEVAALLEAALQGRQADVVVSDMAPNLSGIESSDAARVQHLIELAVEFAQNHMKPQGALVVKVFHGSGYSQIVKMFKETFKVVKPIKPKSSRDKSSETFLVVMGLIHATLPLNSSLFEGQTVICSLQWLAAGLK